MNTQVVTSGCANLSPQRLQSQVNRAKETKVPISPKAKESSVTVSNASHLWSQGLEIDRHIFPLRRWPHQEKKGLLYKYEGLISDSEHSHKSQVWGCMPLISVSSGGGGAYIWSLEAKPNLWAPGSVRNPYSKPKKKSDWGRHPKSTSGCHIHVHPCTHL